MACGGQISHSVLYPCSKEQTNYVRLCRVTVDLCSVILRDCFEKEVPRHTFKSEISKCHSLKLNGNERIKVRNVQHDGYEKFDVSLLYKLIRVVCTGIVPPTKGWGKYPDYKDVSISDDIERIKIIRDTLFHIEEASLPDTAFASHWKTLEAVMARMDKHLSKAYLHQLKEIEHDTMDSNTEEQYIDTLKELRTQEGEVKEKYEILTDRVTEMTSLLSQVHKKILQNEDSLLSRKQKRRIAKAFCTLKTHTKDTTFVVTRAVEYGMKILEECRILIYKGIVGSGKTSNAKEAMNRFIEKNKEYIPIILDDVVEWNNTIDANMNIIVLLDDFLGKTNAKMDLVTDGDKYWDNIYSCIQSGQVRAILTIQSDIMDEHWYELQSSKLFQNRYILDVSSDSIQFDSDERFEILKRHCQHNGIKICDEMCNNVIRCENAVYLSSDTRSDVLSCMSAKGIIQSRQLIGFPKACYLFCSDNSYAKTDNNFFMRPMEDIIKKLNTMRKSKDQSAKIQYCLLVYIMIEQGKLKPNAIDMKLFNRIATDIRLCRPVEFGDIIDAIDDGCNRYFEKTDKGIYEIKHQSILEAVALSMGRYKPELVVELCDFPFLEKFVRTQNCCTTEDSIFLELCQESFKCLFHRFLSELKSNTPKSGRCGCHPAMNDPTFVKEFLSTVDKTLESKKLLENSCKSRTGIFHHACIYGRTPLIDLLLAGNYVESGLVETGFTISMMFNHVKSVECFMKHRNLCVYDKLSQGVRLAMICGNSDTIKYIITHPSIDGDIVWLILTDCLVLGIPNIIELILENRPDINAQDCTDALKTTCDDFVFNTTKTIAVILKKRPRLFYTENMRLRKVLRQLDRAIRNNDIITICHILQERNDIPFRKINSMFARLSRMERLYVFHFMLENGHVLTAEQVAFILIQSLPQAEKLYNISCVCESACSEIVSHLVFEICSNIIQGFKTFALFNSDFINIFTSFLSHIDHFETIENENLHLLSHDEENVPLDRYFKILSKEISSVCLKLVVNKLKTNLINQKQYEMLENVGDYITQAIEHDIDKCFENLPLMLIKSLLT